MFFIPFYLFTGGEEDLAQMLGASGIRRVCPSSMIVNQGDLTIHASQFHHPSHLHHAATIVHHQDPSLGHHSSLMDAQGALLQAEVDEEDSSGDCDKENHMDGFIVSAPAKNH